MAAAFHIRVPMKDCIMYIDVMNHAKFGNYICLRAKLYSKDTIIHACTVFVPPV